MTTVLLTLSIVYLAAAIGLYIIILLESRARDFKVGFVGFAVAVFWLPWVTWYFIAAIKLWWKRNH